MSSSSIFVPSKLLKVRTTGRTDVEMKCLAEIFFLKANSSKRRKR